MTAVAERESFQETVLANAIRHELDIRLLGVAANNPFPWADSSPRSVMYGQHQGQSLVTLDCGIRRLVTGSERQFGKATFSKKFNCNANVIQIVPRYPKTIGSDYIAENPEEVVIYDDVDTRMIHVMSLEKHHCIHQHFGFKYKSTKARENLHRGASFAKGTILADSPAIDEHGNYKYVTNTQVAYMSLPGVIEDGVIISKSYAKRLTTKGFETVTASWGRTHYPVNLYGDPTNPERYKGFPDIGDVIRQDGAVFGLREYDDLLGPVEMTPEALANPDYFHDKITYLTKPGAKVVDVKVWRAGNDRFSPTPEAMVRQCDKYYNAQLAFYRKLLQIYNDLRKTRQGYFKISKPFSALLVEALSYLPDHEVSGGKVKKTLRRELLDDVYVSVTVEYDEVADVGFKVTGLHGNKGVVCAVWEDEWMPVDAQGNRAELIMDGDSITKRMNIGCLYEHYHNAVSRDVSKKVREITGFGYSTDPKTLPLPSRQVVDPALLTAAWNYLAPYYATVTPEMYGLLTGPKYHAKAGPDPYGQHVKQIVHDGVYLYMPPNNPIDPVETIVWLEANYPPFRGPVTFFGPSGNWVTTKEDVMIAEAAILLLEKTGGDYSGVATAKLQHFGIPAKLTKLDARSSPVREQPVRVTGETEIMLINAVCGSAVVADLQDQSNNPAVHKAVVASIYNAPFPSHIAEVVDRTQFPEGNGRNLVFIRHILECSGAKFVYQPEDIHAPTEIYA